MTIHYERRGPEARITIDRPRFNALDHNTANDLHDGIKQAYSDPSVRLVTITGTGKYFSTGFDLFSIDENNTTAISAGQRDVFNPLTRTIYEGEKPVITLLNGDAYGAGLAIALASDAIYAHKDAKLAFTAAKSGILLVCGASYLLPRRAGVERAGKILSRSEIITADKALIDGVVDLVYSSQEYIDAEIADIAKTPDPNGRRMKRRRRFHTNSSPSEIKVNLFPEQVNGQNRAYWAIKEALNNPRNTLQDHLDFEIELQLPCLESETFKQAVRAMKARSQRRK